MDNKNFDQNPIENDKITELIDRLCMQKGNRFEVKKSIRPMRSLKRFSVSPRKFVGVTKVRKSEHPQEKSLKSI